MPVYSDGVNNYGEFIAGTDPLDSSSALLIVNAAQNGTGQVVVKWSSSSHRTYNLERCTNIVTGIYQPVGHNLPATPPANTFTDTVTGVSTPFYRISVH